MTETDSKTSETSTEEATQAESEGAAPIDVAEAPDAGTGETADAGTGEAADVGTGAAADADTVSGDLAAAEAHADTVTGSEAPGAGKKKRRRRRKKKGAGPSEAPADSKAPLHHAPFLHLFAGAARKHAFSVGEVIAGRVERVEHGAIVVDRSSVPTLFAPRGTSRRLVRGNELDWLTVDDFEAVQLPPIFKDPPLAEIALEGPAAQSEGTVQSGQAAGSGQ